MSNLNKITIKNYKNYNLNYNKLNIKLSEHCKLTV